MPIASTEMSEFQGEVLIEVTDRVARVAPGLEQLLAPHLVLTVYRDVPGGPRGRRPLYRRDEQGRLLIPPPDTSRWW
jgi:hypothetical protein